MITTGGQPRLTRALGVYCPSGFTDLFFCRLETAFLDRAMDLRADPVNNSSTQDLQVLNCTSPRNRRRRRLRSAVRSAPARRLRENRLNEIACSGVDADCIQGGAAGKLVSDGAAIRVAGPFAGDNLATGIMA